MGLSQQTIPPFVRFVFLLDLVLIIFAIVHGSMTTNAVYHFQESRLITFLSSFQLITIATIAWLIYESESNQANTTTHQAGSFFWVVVSVGFLFLAFDEVMMIHEETDYAIHRFLNLKETAITDHIDDVIVLLYAVMGWYYLYRSRSVLQRYHKAVKPIVLYVIVAVLLMVVLDIVTNNRYIISDKTISDVLAVMEDSLKIAAEALLIFAAYLCYRIAQDSK